VLHAVQNAAVALFGSVRTGSSFEVFVEQMPAFVADERVKGAADLPMVFAQ